MECIIILIIKNNQCTFVTVLRDYQQKETDDTKRKIQEARVIIKILFFNKHGNDNDKVTLHVFSRFI